MAAVIARPAFSALLPHPPIIVPAVAGPRLQDCLATYDACRELASRLVATHPARLFLVSPHSPRQGDTFGLWGGRELTGDLGRFGAPGAEVSLPADVTLRSRLHELAGSHPALQLSTLAPQALDHGAVVPLWFLVQAGWRGPTTIASLPDRPRPEACMAFGRLIAEVMGQVGGATALVASGDMSHRCLRGAPAGYHPRAVEFDRLLVNLIADGHLAEVAEIDPELRQLAAEDTADSTMIITSAHQQTPRGAEVLSYEHPFGVGYLVAVFHDGEG